jgi:hypothetical protein
MSSEGLNITPDVERDAANVAALLDGIDGAYERARVGEMQAAAGHTAHLDDL